MSQTRFTFHRCSDLNIGGWTGAVKYPVAEFDMLYLDSKNDMSGPQL